MKRLLLVFQAFLLISNGFASGKHELKACLKYPHYMPIGAATFFGFMTTVSAYQEYHEPAPRPRGLPTVLFGSMTGIFVYEQFVARKNQGRPFLVTNERGIWYDAVLYKRDIFYAWNQIEDIEWIK